MITPKTPYEKAGEGVLIPTPKLLNQFEDDAILQSLLQRILPSAAYKSLAPDFLSLADKAATIYFELAKQQEIFSPKLQKYDAYGHTINKIITCAAWKQQHDVAATEGVVALAYQPNKFSARISPQYWRIYQFTKLLLWGPSSGLYTCPIAMTDGAAKLLSVICSKNRQHPSHRYPCINTNISPNNMDVLRSAYNRLTSFDKHSFWTSGQWMTERGGGSDVSHNGTNTIAKQQALHSDKYRLFGLKWFSSATDANVAITVARIEAYDKNKIIAGNKGVSCFYIPDVNVNRNNNIDVIQLKDKLGTRQVPTAELQLNGTRAILLSKQGKGIQTIMMLANITRIHNAISSCGAIKRTLALIRGYAKERMVYNRQLSTIPLHQKTMANIDIFYRMCLYFTMECVVLLGRSEHIYGDGNGEDNQLLLRFLTPLCKLYTAKCAVFCASEGIECMGGIGYLETSHMPQIYRDAQVLPVWEGTTNVLSLDALRVLNHKMDGRKTLNLYYKRVHGIIKLDKTKNKKLKQEFEVLQRFWNRFSDNGRLCELYARDISYSFFRVYCCALLYEQAYYSRNTIDMNVYDRFIHGNMQSFVIGDCGALVSRSLINLLNGNVNKNQYANQIKYLQQLGMGKYSKL